MKKKFNWVEIQEYYDNNHSWRDVIKKFNVSNSALNKAKKRGDFKSRTKSESQKLSNKIRPRKLSEETKRKISESRKKYLNDNPDKIPYKLNHYSKGASYPERYFTKIFNDNNLKFINELPIGLYSLDFAFNGKINVEIDGEQHYLDEKILKSNKNRDIFLKKMGWKIIRIRWSHYQKLCDTEKYKFINELINILINKKFEFNIDPLLKEKKYYCNNCNVEITKYSKSGLCQKCIKIQQRKIKRPSHEQLLKEIEELGYLATGRKYGVSDNAIRKWLKK